MRSACSVLGVCKRLEPCRKSKDEGLAPQSQAETQPPRPRGPHPAPSSAFPLTWWLWTVPLLEVSLLGSGVPLEPAHSSAWTFPGCARSWPCVRPELGSSPGSLDPGTTAARREGAPSKALGLSHNVLSQEREKGCRLASCPAWTLPVSAGRHRKDEPAGHRK